MTIRYYNLSTEDNPRHKSYILFDGNKEIGSVSGNLFPESIFISIINIFPDFQGKGIGFEVFNTVFNEINNFEEIKTIRAVWCVADEYNHCENGMSTNLNEFQKQRQTKSEQESCFLTPTGKWATRLGFNNAKIIRLNDDEVSVDFTR